MNFSSHDRPQNGDFVRKFDFKISIFGFYRDALEQFNSIQFVLLLQEKRIRKCRDRYGTVVT